MTPDKVIAHECGHAIGLLLCGHGVAEVRVDHELVGELGRVEADFTDSGADYGCVIALVMGPMAAGDPPLAWPPDPDSAIRDERNLATLVEHLNLSEGDYRAAIAFAATWLDWHEVKGACALLGQALGRVPVISGRQLEELLGPERLARLRHEEAAPCST